MLANDLAAWIAELRRTLGGGRAHWRPAARAPAGARSVYCAIPGPGDPAVLPRPVLTRWLLAAGLLLTLAASPVLAQGSPYRAANPEYGLSAFLYDRPATTERDLGKITALGFGWTRQLFPWAGIEKERKGAYDWAEADRVVAAAAAAGLKVIARLDRQPAWARADRAATGPPDNFQDYADFVAAFVARYREGSPLGRVQAIQVWNEPNLDREWGGKQPINRQSAAEYVRLLSLAYTAAKAADPTITVIGANLAPTGWIGPEALPDDQYLRAMFEAGLKGNYDVLGVNANVQCPCVDAPLGSVPRFTHPSFYFRRVEQLREIMVANGDADKQVWLVEFGWTTDPIHESYAWYATDEDKKAELIVQAFQYASQHWAPWIGVMTLWTIADPGWGPQDEQAWWAVTNPDGSPRPAYDRLLQAVGANELPGMSRAQPTPRPEALVAEAETQAVPTADSAELGRPGPEQLRVVGTDGAGVSLRASPSLAAARIATVPEGARLLAVGDPHESEGRTWRNVRDADGHEGWVAAEFLAPA